MMNSSVCSKRAIIEEFRQKLPKQVSENILKNLECENSVFAAKIEFSHSIKVHKIN